MRKNLIKVIPLLLILTICTIAVAQPMTLSEPFSRSAVLALRAINATGWALPASVRELEARQADAQSKMEDAKQAAQSQNDIDAFIYLQRYQLRHSQNFADYSNAVTRAAGRMTGKDSLQRAAALVAKDPKFVARKKKETACAAALEKTLQSRAFSQPRACELY